MFKLIIGPNELRWNFGSTEERDLVFENMSKNYGWSPEYAEKLGDRDIGLHPDKMPYAYTWYCEFSSK